MSLELLALHSYERRSRPTNVRNGSDPALPRRPSSAGRQSGVACPATGQNLYAEVLGGDVRLCICGRPSSGGKVFSCGFTTEVLCYSFRLSLKTKGCEHLKRRILKILLKVAGRPRSSRDGRVGIKYHWASDVSICT
jgi:hypothetical protein